LGLTAGAGAEVAGLGAATFAAGFAAHVPEGCAAETDALAGEDDFTVETACADASCSSFTAVWRALAPTGTAQEGVSDAVPGFR
jgi:hypothetical protein